MTSPLLTKVLKPFLTRGNQGNHATASSNHKYVITEVISGISDPFDAQEIWSHTGAFKDAFRGDSPSRLKNILDSATYRVGKKDFVYPHLVLELPSEDISDDRVVTKGKRRAALLSEVNMLMEGGFSKRIENDKNLRVEVHPGIDLSPGSIRVRIGHGIYVRDESDIPQWEVKYSLDGVVNWACLATVMQQQNFLVVGKNPDLVTVAMPDWPFGEDALLRLHNDDSDGCKLVVDPSPNSGLTVRHDDNLNAELVEDGTSCLYLRFNRLIEPELVKPVKVASPVIVQPAAEIVASDAGKNDRVEHVIKLDEVMPSEIVGVPDESGTFVQTSVEAEEEGTIMPQSARSKHRISVVGIALQRVSLYSGALTGLSFGFDSKANVIPVGQNNSALVIGFAVDVEDHLSVLTGRGSRPVSIGEALPMPGFGTVCLDAAPQEMAAHYLGICRLPVAVSEKMGVAARFSVGRGQTFLQRLCLMSGKGFIQSSRSVGGDHMGFSSQAFTLEVGADGLLLTPAGRSPIFHLDENMAFCEQIALGSNRVYTIPSGHHIVAGHYVLRYEA